MSQETIRVLLVDDIADTRENLKKLLFFEEDIVVVGAAGTGEEGIELAKQLNPDIVIMDINMPGIDGITAAEILTRELPGIQIIMMSVQGEADYLRRSMLAGAREFLIKPPSAEQVITSIRRVYELGRAQRSQMAAQSVQAPIVVVQEVQSAAPIQVAARSARHGKVVAVFGSKGGVGTSSIAVNLAIALREQQSEARVAVVDGNTEFGDLSVLLNLNADRTIVDLIDVEELETQYINDVFIPHASGIKVLPGSPPMEAELVTNEQMRRVITALRLEFDFIVFDTRPTFGEPILTILDGADSVVLVTTADIPSIRNSRLFFEVAEQLNYPPDKVRLVLNKYEPQGNVSSAAIQASIKHPIIVELPRDDRAASSAIQQGLPYVMGNPRSQLAQGTVKLARALIGAQEERAPEVERKAARGSASLQPMQQPKRALFGKLFSR
jgi:pilus assembly protein CpaE